MEESMTDIVVATPGEASLTLALQAATRFVSAVRPSSEVDMGAPRRLTWLTGNNSKFAANGRTSLGEAKGWFIDKPDEDELFPDDYEFMDAMQLLVEQGSAQDCVVAHPEGQGKPRMVPCWHLPVASLFVVCEGVPSKEEMKDPKERWGVTYAGYQVGAKSTVIFQAFIKEIMDAGYNGIFTTKFEANRTDKILACLYAHQRYTLNIADKLRRRANITEPLPFYAYALPIRCSVKTITAGKKIGETKEVYYPIPDIPHLSTPELALDFLARMAISDCQALALESDGRVERTTEWSVNRSQRLIAGEDISDEAMTETDTPF